MAPKYSFHGILQEIDHKMENDFTKEEGGHFPIISLRNCPFITEFPYNMVHSYGPHQTKFYKETAIALT